MIEDKKVNILYSYIYKTWSILTNHKNYILDFSYISTIYKLILPPPPLQKIQVPTRSSAVTGFPEVSEATTILPSRSLMSPREVVRARTAIISLATLMSNWHSRVLSFSVGLWPIVILRRNLSFVSKTKRGSKWNEMLKEKKRKEIN